MTIRIAGINHFDPSGRERLRRWLGECSSRGYGLPCFLASEWDPEIFRRVQAQRERFRGLLQEQWPDMSQRLLETLTRSLAYEGDSHLDFFPQVEVLWLDAGRRLDDGLIGEIDRYAEGRLALYREFLGERANLADENSVLARMSEAAERQAERPDYRGNERDRRFADLIAQRVDPDSGTWAVVVVGKNHASPTDGTMRRLLENRGLRCEAVFL